MQEKADEKEDNKKIFFMAVNFLLRNEWKLHASHFILPLDVTQTISGRREEKNLIKIIRQSQFAEKLNCQKIQQINRMENPARFLAACLP